MQTTHLDSLRAAIRERSTAEPPPPWIRMATFAIAGLLEVGFSRESEHLLIASSSGRGVIDCACGEQVARDYSEYPSTDRYLECQGIGPLAGESIRMSGMSGGGLASGTVDGWVTEAVSLDWPNHHLLLVEPDSWLYGARYSRPSSFHKLATASELRAFGFSYSGLTLIIAAASDVTIYRREHA